jgi:hypothetical protein
MPAKPKLTVFGSTYGEYGGDQLGDQTIPGDISESLLNTTLMSDGVEFNRFERNIHDFVMARLGDGVVRVELTPFQIKTCIDEATTQLSYHAPIWATQYAVFEASAGISVYELPQYVLNNLEYVVYKKTLLSIQSQAGTLEFDFFIRFFQDNFLFQDFQVGEFFLLQQHLEMIRKVLSQEGSHDVINGKWLQIAPRPVTTPQEVIVEYRALDSDTIHPAYRNWIQRFALACSKEVLGEIRGKYQQLPGPGGGTVLNGEAMIQRAREDKQLLMEELLKQIEEPPFFTAF